MDAGNGLPIGCSPARLPLQEPPPSASLASGTRPTTETQQPRTKRHATSAKRERRAAMVRAEQLTASDPPLSDTAAPLQGDPHNSMASSAAAPSPAHKQLSRSSGRQQPPKPLTTQSPAHAATQPAAQPSPPSPISPTDPQLTTILTQLQALQATITYHGALFG